MKRLIKWFIIIALKVTTINYRFKLMYLRAKYLKIINWIEFIIIKRIKLCSKELIERNIKRLWKAKRVKKYKFTKNWFV